MRRKFGVSFSWKRAMGISAAKNRLSRQIGIPLTRSGRRRKIKRATGCFVATSVYESNNAPEVQMLRRFRNDVLLKNILGRFIVGCYYRIGPYLAWVVNKIPILKRFLRVLLDKLLILLNKSPDGDKVQKS